MFAGLTGPSDPTAGHRVTLAACLLDRGWPPAALLEELGLADGPVSVEKYNPNHVPAGHGGRSGQFDFRSGASSTASYRIVIAQEETEKDVAHPTAEKPHAVYDLKTGGATLTDVRREQFRMHLPKRDDGRDIDIQ